MPQLIKSTEGVRKHDVVMVHQTLVNKQTKEPYVWRWFGLVIHPELTWKHLAVVRVGADTKEGARPLSVNRDDIQVFLLDESEWPDGLHVFTMIRALEGDIDIT